MAFGQKDARGIYLYGEDDDEANHSSLLNLGQASVSETLKYFSGTPAEREALTPAPEGATWQDTTGSRTTWQGVSGAWVALRPVTPKTAYTPTVAGYETGFAPNLSAAYARHGDAVTASIRTTVNREASRITGIVTVTLPVAADTASIEGGGFILDNTTGEFYDVRLRSASGTTVTLEVLLPGATGAVRRSPLRNSGIAAANMTSWNISLTYLAA